MLSDQELQSLRNWGNLAEEAADEICALRAALAAQPAEPVAWDAALNTLAQVFHNGEEAEGDDGAVMMVDLALWNEGCEALESLVSEDELAAPPAPVPPEPIAEMDAVAIRYAHKMALDLECILAEYGGSWYNTAIQTLGEYRSEMNAIHERECPTFMGEPVIAAAGDKP